MKAILYPRVSSKRQAEEGDSIEAQIERLKRYCDENNIEVIGIYTDAGKSASIADDKIDMGLKGHKFFSGFDLRKRPGFEKLMNGASKKKFDAVVFYKWDRFSRNPIFCGLARIFFERFGVELIPTDDSTDSLMIEIKSLLSAEEVKKSVERVRLVRLERFNKGIMVGRAPVGYKFNKRKKIVEIDPNKSEMIKMIFELTSIGEDYRSICSGCGIQPAQYYNIVRNKTYCGYVSFEGETKKGIHEPIISEKLFNEANAIFK